MASPTLARPLLGSLDNVVRAKRKCNAALWGASFALGNDRVNLGHSPRGLDHENISGGHDGSQGSLLCGAVGIESGGAGGDGLLPLPILPRVVGRTGQRLQPLAARTVRVTRGPTSRDVLENADERTPIL